jgi:hypothetical protein
MAVLNEQLANQASRRRKIIKRAAIGIGIAVFLLIAVYIFCKVFPDSTTVSGITMILSSNQMKRFPRPFHWMLGNECWASQIFSLDT